MNSTSRLNTESLDLAYTGTDLIVSDLSLRVADGQITALCGPNACGKSTLLRALARLLKPRRGAVRLDGQEIAALPTKEVATKLGLLPQSPSEPEGITVEDLVARGRFPHQRLFRQWGDEDENALESALAMTHTEVLRNRPVDELSGGQRQRAWIAMALAQETDILLLDEPTTYLDLAHRVDVLELLAELNESRSRTIVMVLHELNEACRYAHRIVAMREGRIQAEGPPSEVVTAELVRTVFDLDTVVIPDPVTSTPLVIPEGGQFRRGPRA
ncbi:iron complex transport system ATP-binding protein [Lipingzhangella halophila]|uniref:Iron complex transport system ATP-binding protein n=1 Tax=Lipingzhangella halophila TaxID=1783352 RepID=A0A7W7RFU2_9ACTN|nr:ABC transporter ATP-binding protein [Lipingzhangella halophila]MBB4931172.1 iron complex transport system ATP-binding protein [Lipingzhangella halophila]